MFPNFHWTWKLAWSNSVQELKWIHWLLNRPLQWHHQCQQKNWKCMCSNKLFCYQWIHHHTGHWLSSMRIVDCCTAPADCCWTIVGQPVLYSIDLMQKKSLKKYNGQFFPNGKKNTFWGIQSLLLYFWDNMWECVEAKGSQQPAWLVNTSAQHWCLQQPQRIQNLNSLLFLYWLEEISEAKWFQW